MQRGDEPSNIDPLIGVMDTVDLAARAVRDHNAALVPPVPTPFEENQV